MTDRIMDPKPEPTEQPEEEIDFDAKFRELDAEIAQKTEEKAALNNEIKEVRVQFRGAPFAESPAIELRVGDTVIAYIRGKDAALIAASLERLGDDGNTVVTWGYLPLPDSTA